MKQTRILKSVLITAIIFALMLIGTVSVFADGEPAAVLSRTTYTLTTGSTLHLKMSDQDGNTIPDADVEWTSSDESVATVNSDGKAKSLQAGTTDITALYNGESYVCKLTVKNPTISRTTYKLTTGGSLHLTIKNAGGTTVSDSNIKWESSNTNVATVSTGGSVKGIKAGTATITGTYKGTALTCKVTVKNPTLSRTSYKLTRGCNLHLTMKNASGETISDSKITWKSSNTAVATVSTGGTIKGIKAGTANITGTYRGIKLTCKITVKSPTFNKSSITLMPKDTFHIQLKNASSKVIDDDNITWKSSNTKVATITTGGYIKAAATGKTTISAKYKGITYKATVKVIKSDYSVGYTSITLNKLAGETIPVTYTGDGSVWYEISSGKTKVTAYWDSNWDGNKAKLWVVPLVKSGTAKIRIYTDATDGYRQVTLNVKADDINEEQAATLITVEAVNLLSNTNDVPTYFDLKNAYYYTGVKNCKDSVGIIRFSYTIGTYSGSHSGTATYCVHMTDGHEVSSTSGTRHKISSSMIKDIEEAANYYGCQGE